MNKNSVIIFLRIDVAGIKKNTISKAFQNQCNSDLIDLCKNYKIIHKIFNISTSFEQLINYLLIENIYNTYSEYITIGYEKDIMSKLILALKNNKIQYTDFLDEYYQDVWNYCDKGFFNFRKNFNEKYI